MTGRWLVAGGLWLAGCVLARPLLAQAPLAPASFARAAPAFAQDSIRPIRFPKTYWLEGARIGALVAGAYMAYGLGAWCRMESAPGRCTGAYIAGALFGGLVGYGVGAFIGSAIPKEE